MASNSTLLVQHTPATIIERIEAAMMEVRGIKQVVVRAHSDYDHEKREMVYSGWVTLIWRGTDLAVAKAGKVAAILANDDQNADHDHEKCLAAARNAGVPAEWAHRIETYLSM